MKKNRIIYLLIAVISFSMLSLASCKRDTEKQLSERATYVTPSESFGLVDTLMNVYLVKDTLNIAEYKDQLASLSFMPSDSVVMTGNMFVFAADFTERATYSIYIYGNRSGAEKRLGGTGIAIDSETAFWTGDSDNMFDFSRGDSLSISLTVLGRDSVYAYFSRPIRANVIN